MENLVYVLSNGLPEIFVREVTKVRHDGKVSREKTRKRAYDFLLGMEYMARQETDISGLYEFVSVPQGMGKKEKIILSRALLYATAELVGKAIRSGHSVGDLELPAHVYDEYGGKQEADKLQTAMINMMKAYSSSIKQSSEKACQNYGKILEEAINRFSIQDVPGFVRKFSPEVGDYSYLETQTLNNIREMIYEYEQAVINKLNSYVQQNS